jgi:hypothetical protein
VPALVPREERCPLCGKTFDAGGQGCRPSCPLAQGCRVVCCPACGYSFPQDTGWAGKLKGWLDRRRETTR